jgi:hypothetical protein
MAALVFFGIMGVAFTSLSMSTVWANHEARRVTAAANLARDMIEELRAANYAAVTSGSDSSAMSESGGSGTGAIYTRSWTVSSGPSGTKQVTVKVEWTDDSTRAVELTTLIANY